jgi:Co/Zn/Cd efflux system component
MEKTLFYVKDMDCPAEEQMVRMKMAGVSAVKRLVFDLEGRNLTVYHDGELEAVKTTLGSLHFGEKLLESIVYNGMPPLENDALDKKLLWTVLIINFSVFAVEIVFGLIAHSMGLVADAMDELSDAIIYALSLYAISGTILVKKRIARISGAFQLLLAVFGFVEVCRRFIGIEPVPNFVFMIIFSCIALAGNTASMILLNKSKTNEVHIKSSKIFTSNDVIVNIGVIVAAVLVSLLQTKIPDLVIGAVVLLFVLRGAIAIFKLSK